MKAAIIDRYGSNDLVGIGEVPEPQLGDGDLLVEIHAASVNPVDFKIREGKLKLILPYKFPLILGNDFSGIVLKAGANSRKFKVGDRVYGRPRKSRTGCFSERIAISEDDVARMPSHLSFEEAASIPLVGLTSWQALFDIGKLKKDQKVFIQAGSGGVGSFAIQLAKQIGAFVATTTSDANVELVKRLGADLVINYKNEKFEDVLSGFDLVLDTLGGAVLEKSLKVLKRGGALVSISGVPDRNLAIEMNKGLAIQFLFALVSWNLRRKAAKQGKSYHFLFMRHSGEQLEKITTLIESGWIKPVIDRVFPFSEIQAALAYVESGRAKGKVVVKLS